MEFTDAEVKELWDICIAAGCCYPANGRGQGSRMSDEVVRMVEDDGSEREVRMPRYAFADDKWRDVFERISDEMDRILGPFSVL